MSRYLLNILLILYPLCLPATSSPVRAELLSEAKQLDANKPIVVGLHLAMAPGWHTYGEEPGLAGMPTEITWDLPEGFEASEIHWPEPVRFESAGLEASGYEGEVTLPVTITPPADLRGQEMVTLSGTALWVACADECVPGQEDVKLVLPVGRMLAAVDPAAQPASDPLGSEQQSGLLLALLFAFLGGMLLNLMPCVLPVISVKILGFVQIAGNERGKILLHSLVYTAGILVCFWSLAALLLILQSAGSSVGWGFHLQSPGFVAVLIAVLFTLGLNLFGVMEVSLPFVPSAAAHQGQSPLLSSFSTGLLTTLVATPCTGPFLGPVLGYAVTLPAWGALSIFTSMGLGLASPYLVLSAAPGLLAYLPKPGAWMLAFKQGMGFLMLASVIWLLWVFEAQTSTDSLFILLLALLCLGAAFWVHGSFRAPVLKRAERSWLAALSYVALLLTAVSLIYSTLSPQPASLAALKGSEWESFNPTRLAQLRAAGQPVFIDFTAKWCALCQVNKPTLHSQTVRQAFEKRGVVTMEADWTKRDPIITEWLQKLGRNGVPLYVLYGPGENSPPRVLPTTLTPELVMNYLEELPKTPESDVH